MKLNIKNAKKLRKKKSLELFNSKFRWKRRNYSKNILRKLQTRKNSINIRKKRKLKKILVFKGNNCNNNLPRSVSHLCKRVQNNLKKKQMLKDGRRKDWSKRRNYKNSYILTISERLKSIREINCKNKFKRNVNILIWFQK